MAKSKLRVVFGCDHAGIDLAEVVQEVVEQRGHEFVFLGTKLRRRTDYPRWAEAVAREVASGRADLGILACGTGVGMAIAANKVVGVYAGHASDPYTARMAREHNAANVLTLGARVVGRELAAEIVGAFLDAEPSQEARHVRRREMVKDIERREGSR